MPFLSQKKSTPTKLTDQEKILIIQAIDSTIASLRDGNSNSGSSGINTQPILNTALRKSITNNEREEAKKTLTKKSDFESSLNTLRSSKEPDMLIALLLAVLKNEETPIFSKDESRKVEEGGQEKVEGSALKNEAAKLIRTTIAAFSKNIYKREDETLDEIKKSLDNLKRDHHEKKSLNHLKASAAIECLNSGLPGALFGKDRVLQKDVASITKFFEKVEHLLPPVLPPDSTPSRSHLYHKEALLPPVPPDSSLPLPLQEARHALTSSAEEAPPAPPRRHSSLPLPLQEARPRHALTSSAEEAPPAPPRHSSLSPPLQEARHAPTPSAEEATPVPPDSTSPKMLITDVDNTLTKNIHLGTTRHRQYLLELIGVLDKTFFTPHVDPCTRDFIVTNKWNEAINNSDNKKKLINTILDNNYLEEGILEQFDKYNKVVMLTGNDEQTANLVLEAAKWQKGQQEWPPKDKVFEIIGSKQLKSIMLDNQQLTDDENYNRYLPHAKKSAIEKLISGNNYASINFIDDSRENIKQAESLQARFSNLICFQKTADITFRESIERLMNSSPTPTEDKASTAAVSTGNEEGELNQASQKPPISPKPPPVSPKPQSEYTNSTGIVEEMTERLASPKKPIPKPRKTGIVEEMTERLASPKKPIPKPRKTGIVQRRVKELEKRPNTARSSLIAQHSVLRDQSACSPTPESLVSPPTVLTSSLQTSGPGP